MTPTAWDSVVMWSLTLKSYQLEGLTPEQREDLYNELVTIEDSFGSILKRYDITY